MKQKEKAKELIDKFYQNGIADENYSMEFPDAVQCALICVDEQIELIKSLDISDMMKQDLVEYQLAVKQEIEKP